MGDGKLVVPVDFGVRRPDPVGPGRPGRAKLTWWQVRLDRRWASLQRRCRGLPPPVVVADRWLGDSAWLEQVHTHQQGAVVVAGKRRSVFALPDGRRVTGADLRTPSDWPWRNSPQVRGLRDARLTAIRATYGRVTRVLVDTPGEARCYVLCPATTISAPRLLRAWRRRRWIEPTFRTLTHLWAAEACQVQTEDAYDGHLVWRLLAGLVLLYTARFRLQGRVTMEEMVLSRKHHWRFLTSEPLE